MPLRADESTKADGKTFQVPFRLTDSNHVVVRVKLNGKGPFNFAVDTGAPYMFVSTATGKKAGVEPNKQGWGSFDRFEIEGGVVLEKAKGRIDSLARLEAAVAFPQILGRFPGLAAAGEPVRKNGLVLRGYESLPVVVA